MIYAIDCEKVGECQRCRKRSGRAYEMNFRGWCTRLCLNCAREIVKQMETLENLQPPAAQSTPQEKP